MTKVSRLVMNVVSVWGFAVLAFASTCSASALPPAMHASAEVLPRLPPALQATAYGALAGDAGPGYTVGDDGCASVDEFGIGACFGHDGVTFHGHDAGDVRLQLLSYGRPGQRVAVDSAAPRVSGNSVRYEHPAITEWWHVMPLGFEQGFTLSRRPAGEGELTLEMSSDRPARVDEDGLAWGALRYGKLVVTDARGTVLPSSLRSTGARVFLAFDDAHAVYPVVVDPLVWTEQKVTAADGQEGDQMGWAVAMDGDTAMLGAFSAAINGNYAQGAVYVFDRIDGVWTQTQKLVADDGAAQDAFGNSIALRGDTAVIGTTAAVHGNRGQGAVYVFARENGMWTQEQKLTADDGKVDDKFGVSVALDGDTIAVGAHVANSVYLFSRSAGSWAQTGKVVSPDGLNGSFGLAIALDGDRLVVGAFSANDEGFSGRGAAYVFERDAGVWSETQQLRPGDAPGYPGSTFYFGHAVALQGDVAMVSARLGSVVYVYDRAGDGSWSQTQKLTPPDGDSTGQFGSSLSMRGNAAIVGAPYAFVTGQGSWAGKAYIFERNASGLWDAQQTLVASDGGPSFQYGWMVSIDGTSALVGSVRATVEGAGFRGAGYFYTGAEPVPVVTVTKSFAPAEVAVEEDSVAIVTLTNPNDTPATLTQPLIDVLPEGLAVVTASTTCGLVRDRAGASTFLSATSENVSLPVGVVLPSNDSCELRITVRAAEVGNYVNVIPAGALQTDIGSNPDGASATLTVVVPQPAPPIAVIEPGFLNFTVAAGDATGAALAIGNIGGSDLRYTIEEGTHNAAKGSSYLTARLRKAGSAASVAGNVANGLAVAPRADRPRRGAAVILDEETTVSQMDDNTPGNEGVSCGANISTAANSWWRRFYFDEHENVDAIATISAVTVSTGTDVPADLPISINLYTIDHDVEVDTIPTSALQLIGSGTGVVNESLASITIPVDGLVDDTAVKDLVVEYHTEGNDNGGQFFPGANASPESHPTFLSSDDCGLAEPTPASMVGEEGFPDFHLTMVVHLQSSEPPPQCEAVADVPWLAASPLAGVVEVNAESLVDVVADAGMLEEGVYLAHLCVSTNDPAKPLTTLPVGLLVMPAEVADTIFCDGFDGAPCDEAPAADADVVRSGPLGTKIPSDHDGLFVDFATGEVSREEIPGFDVSAYGSGGKLLFYWGDGHSIGTNAGLAVGTTGPYRLLRVGDVVGPGMSFSAVADGYYDETAPFQGTAEGYLGVRFFNENSGRINYGYLHLKTSAPHGFPAEIVDYAYRPDGGAMTIP